MKRLVVGMLLLFSLSVTASELIDENIIRQYMEFGDIPEIVVVVIDNNHKGDIISLSKNTSDNNKREASNSLFELASISKSFTGLIAAKFIEEGRISPDATVTSVFPSIKIYYEGKQANVTFLQLLNHSSGISFQSIDKLYAHPDHTLTQVVDHIERIDLKSAPGEKHTYATLNYDIAARMMEKVSGQSYQQLLQQEILIPLNMTHTSVSTVVQNKVQGHQINFLQARKYDAPFVLSNIPAGYIQTNAIDMLKWLKFWARQEPDSSLQKAKIMVLSERFGVHTGGQEDSIYGFGWYKQNSKLFHTGMNPSFSCYVAVDIDTGSAIAVMANVNSNITFNIGEQVMKQISGEGTMKSPTELQDLVLFDTYDRIFVCSSLILFLLILVVFYVNSKWASKCKPERGMRFIWTVLSLVIFLIIILALFFPQMLIGVSWSTLSIWLPGSFWLFYSLLLALLLLCFFCLLLFCYRQKQCNR